MLLLQYLSRFGKIGSVVGENAGLIILIALFGNKIPKEYLIAIHSVIVGLKTLYLAYNKSSPRVEVDETVSLFPLGKESAMPITVEDRALAAAQAVARITPAENGAKITVNDVAKAIAVEFNKTEEDYYNEAVKKLSPVEKKILLERLQQEKVQS